MSQTPAPIPAPIPPCSAPADAPVWSSEEAARWSDLRHASWARPLWSVLALLITVVWAIAVEPEQPCTDAVPCGADWPGMVQMGLALGLLYWLARLPELALVAAPVLAAVVARVELPGAGPNSLAANLGVLTALGFGWAAALQRIVARRRQRDLVEGAFGVRHPLPGPGVPLRRGTVPIAAGAVLVAVAAFGVVQGLTGVRDDERHADRAVPTVAKVVGHDDESVRVRTEGGRRLTLESLLPEDHRTGSSVTVLEDGRWRRLASEPYDAMGPQLVVLAAGLPGLSLLVTGLLARRRAAALRRGPVPVLRVLESAGDDGLVWIHAGDDTAARRPVLGASFVADDPGAAHRADDDEWVPPAEDEAREEPVDEAPEEPVPATTRPREAVLFGAPYEGGELLLVTVSGDGGPAVLRTCGPVRLPGPGREQGRASQEAAHTTKTTGVPTAPITPGHPLSWGPSAPVRAVGAVLAPALIAVAAVNVRSLVTDGIDAEAVFLLLCALAGLGSAAELLDWRVTADGSGLWLSGWWKVRHVPWDHVRSARYTKEGWVEIRLLDGPGWQLPGLGMPRLERRFGLDPSHVRMTREVTALRDHPELRPTEPASRRSRGLPLVPALLALTVVVAAAWGLH
ncbi:hypothetical protein [Streptomyces sp. NPDC058751]|uniref:hypothetical protein n=1 Tax=Streptomyces sp. NPDC058751 TaxID=3346623 RepID=UPI00369B91EB